MKINTLFPAKRPVLVKAGGDWPLIDQFVGVEIEVEGFRNREQTGQLNYWSIHEDASLRNHGIEFVLSQPLAGATLSSAISELFRQNWQWEGNFRTSTHLHLDFSQDDDVALLKTLLTIVYVIEPFFFEVGHRDRKFSNYCTPLDNATVNAMRGVFAYADKDDPSSRANLIDSIQSTDRYYGLNLVALAKYNTVEFRYFPSPETGERGEKQVREWINLCMSLKRAAKEWQDRRDKQPLHIFLGQGPERVIEFISKYLSAWESSIFKHLSANDISMRSAELVVADQPADSASSRVLSVRRNNKYALKFFKKQGLQSSFFTDASQSSEQEIVDVSITFDTDQSQVLEELAATRQAAHVLRNTSAQPQAIRPVEDVIATRRRQQQLESLSRQLGMRSADIAWTTYFTNTTDPERR